MNNFIFCPYCKSKLVNLEDYYHCPQCQKTIYKHSSITASIYPIKERKVLLSIRAVSPQKGKQDAIGGFLKYGEHPETGVLRESKEETNLNIKPIHLLGVYMDTHILKGIKRKTLNFFYIGKIISGNPKASDDVRELFWQPIKNLPKNFGFRCCIDSYLDLQKWYNKPHRGVV